jgi:hypothetical protein
MVGSLNFDMGKNTENTLPYTKLWPYGHELPTTTFASKLLKELVMAVPQHLVGNCTT